VVVRGLGNVGFCASENRSSRTTFVFARARVLHSPSPMGASVVERAGSAPVVERADDAPPSPPAVASTSPSPLSPLSSVAAALQPSWLPPLPSVNIKPGHAVAAAFASVALLGAAFTAPFFVVPWLPRRVFGGLPYYATSPRRVRRLLAALPPSHTDPGRAFVDLGSGDGVAVFAAAERGMRAYGVELNMSLVAVSKLAARQKGYAAAPGPWPGEEDGMTSSRLGGPSSVKDGMTSSRLDGPSSVEDGTTSSRLDGPSSAAQSADRVPLQVHEGIEWPAHPDSPPSSSPISPPAQQPLPPSRGTATFRNGNLFNTALGGYDVVLVFGVVPIMRRLEVKLAQECPPHVLICSHKFPLPLDQGTGLRKIADVDGFLVYARAGGGGGGAAAGEGVPGGKGH
jgi:hypothetical protein